MASYDEENQTVVRRRADQPRPSGALFRNLLVIEVIVEF